MCIRDRTKACLNELAEARKRVDRPAELGELIVSITPPVGTGDDDLRRYEDLGVHRLVPIGFLGDTAQMVAQIEHNAGVFG